MRPWATPSGARAGSGRPDARAGLESGMLRPVRLAAAAAFAALAGACATARPAVKPVDLQPARQALEAARQAGAPEQAKDSFGAAEAQLKKAESLAPAA